MFFFNAIYSKVIDPKQLDDLENEASIIICQLEMYFPPAFFDIMVHLVVHLVREIRLCGPVYLRWMYPVERYMKVLKGYTKNQYRPEASIVERYVAEEAIAFCSEYIENGSPVGLPESRHDSTRQGRGTRGFNVVTMDREQVSQAHLYVRDCLDVMHVEKNVCDSLVGPLLNIKGKTKDGLKYRQDLVEMGI